MLKTKSTISNFWRDSMATIIGEPKRSTYTATIGRRQTSLSECLTQATLTQARLNLAKRSLEKKSATLPHSGSNASLNNAVRPLPTPPPLTEHRDTSEHRDTYRDRPWFHNLTREQANGLIKEQCTYHNAPDGYFLMRPSTTIPNNPLTLVLWCKDRVYNVPVRRRPDNRYSLGKEKKDEQSFASIDDIVPFYKKELLVLYTGGVQTGSTRLSETPPKEKLNTF